MNHELLDYINYCLAQATLVPSLTDIWESQAFGALNLYYRVTIKSDPHAASNMCQYWNEEISPQFLEIREKKSLTIPAKYDIIGAQTKERN